MILYGLLLWVGFGFLGGYLTARKGYPPLIGILVGLSSILFGPFVLAIVLFLPTTSQRREQIAQENETATELAAASMIQACPKCGRQNSCTTPVCPRCNRRLIWETAMAE